jgi:callose synthase
LGRRFDFYRMLSFYFTTVGFYFSSMVCWSDFFILLSLCWTDFLVFCFL